MIYPWLKALHVAAVMVFVGGLLALSILATAGPPAAAALRRWDRAATVPAMMLAWASGLGLAIGGQWFPQGWLLVKLGLVLLLSGLHGMQSGRLRRHAGGAGPPPLRSAPLVLAALSAIAVLAVVKP